MKYLILLVILFGFLMVLYYRLKRWFASVLGSDNDKSALSAGAGPTNASSKKPGS